MSLFNECSSEENDLDQDSSYPYMDKDCARLEFEECHSDSENNEFAYSENSDTEKIIENDHRKSVPHRFIRRMDISKNGEKADYHLLSNDEMEFHNSSVNFESSFYTIWAPSPMSPVRRAFFIASIMFGFLVFSTFLWALPCNVQPCESKCDAVPQHWFKIFEDISVDSVHVIETSSGNSQLLFGFHLIPKFWDNSTKTSSAVNSKFDPVACGLMGLEETSGNRIWKKEIEHCPSNIFCHLMDATGDGVNDCLVTRKNSTPFVVEPLSGSILWEVQLKNSLKDKFCFNDSTINFGKPVVFEDLDGDATPDLLFPFKNTLVLSSETREACDEAESGPQLMLVSGMTGTPIRSPFNLSICDDVISIDVVGLELVYTCQTTAGKDYTGQISVTKLLEDFGIESDKIKENSSPLKEFINETSACPLRVTNHGVCPFCRAVVDFGLPSDHPLVMEYQNTKIVAMHFMSNESCEGVVLKFWTWSDYASDALYPGINDTPLHTHHSESRYKPVSQNESDQIPSKRELCKAAMVNLQPSSRKDLVSRNSHQRKRNSTRGHNLYENRHLEKHHLINGTRSDSYMFNSEDSKDNSSADSASHHHHHHKNVLVTTTHESPSQTNTEGVRPPAGVCLEKIEEVLSAFFFNDTQWYSQKLGSMMVYRLCKDNCYPSVSSQRDSVFVKRSGSFEWNVYSSSSTYSSLRDDEDPNASVKWSHESYVRKLPTSIDKASVVDV